MLARNEHIDKIWNIAKNLGGSLSDFTVWMLERSLKTMNLRVKRQQKSAKKLAKYLSESSFVKKVYYPGLKSHPNHLLAKKQMKFFEELQSTLYYQSQKMGISIKNFLKINKTFNEFSWC